MIDIERMREIIRAATDVIDKLATKIKTLEADNRKLEDQKDGANKNFREMYQEIEGLRKERNELKAELALWEPAARALEAERDGLKACAEKCRAALMEVEGDRDRWRLAAAKVADEIEDIRKERVDLKIELAKAKAEREIARDEIHRLKETGSARITMMPRRYSALAQETYAQVQPGTSTWDAMIFTPIYDHALSKIAALVSDDGDAKKIIDALHAQMISDMRSPYAPKAEAKASDGPIHAPEITSSPAYYVGTKDALTGVPIYCITAVGPLVVCRTSGLARSVADALNGLIQGHEYRFDKNPWAAKVADLEMIQRALLEDLTAVRKLIMINKGESLSWYAVARIYILVQDAIVKAGGPKS